MKCPVDNAVLALSERQGIEVDYCPECRGVWLDRGELDKLIDRANQQGAVEVSDTRHHASQHDSYSDEYRRPKHKKRESFLGDIFDF